MRLIAQGREAEVYERGDGTVLKLLRDPEDLDRAQTEVAALQVLRVHGYPSPRAVEIVTVEGRPGVVLERVDGSDLLTRLGRRPLAVRKVGRAMAEVHAAMHEISAPAELPSSHELLRERILSAAPLPDELRAAVLALLERLPGGDRLCHGDLHPGNLLGSLSAPVVIDWGDASRGDPIADVARSDLLLRVGVPPPGSSVVLRVLDRYGRRFLADGYLTRYRRLRPFDLDRFSQWRVVRAAARLYEPIPEEHPILLRIVGEGLVTGRRR